MDDEEEDHEERVWRDSIQEGADLEVIAFPKVVPARAGLLDFMHGYNFNSESKERVQNLKAVYDNTWWYNSSLLCEIHAQPGVSIACGKKGGPVALVSVARKVIYAREKRNVPFFQLLQHPAIDVNLCDEVEAALHALITHGYDPFTIALQLLLLKQELNVNIFNVMGQTALQIACVLHRQRMGRLILDDPRTDINACKSTQQACLVGAVQQCPGHPEMLNMLLAHSSDKGDRFSNEILMAAWDMANRLNLPDIAARLSKHDQLHFCWSFDELEIAILLAISALLAKRLIVSQLL